MGAAMARRQKAVAAKSTGLLRTKAGPTPEQQHAHEDETAGRTFLNRGWQSAGPLEVSPIILRRGALPVKARFTGNYV